MLASRRHPPAPRARGGVETPNILDDYSRPLIAGLARRTIDGAGVVDTFISAFTRCDNPASVLTNSVAASLPCARRGGRTVLKPVRLPSDIADTARHPRVTICVQASVIFLSQGERN